MAMCTVRTDTITTDRKYIDSASAIDHESE
jgi:hypothetical protein